MRLLVLDAYAAAGRAALRDAGATLAGSLYERLLQALEPDAEIVVGTPADADWALSPGAGLADFDGIVWTGSSLTIHDGGDPAVGRQVALAREAYAQGVPQFGSCWAAQLAVVAAGGTCAPSPRGREFGVARKIVPDGPPHPLLAGKPAAFDALASHEDEVRSLPPGGRLLASNAWSRVQAVAIEHGAGSFWAVQYHPEYDLREVARLSILRGAGLVEEGRFADLGAVGAWRERMEILHEAPYRSDLANELGVDGDVLDARVRTLEPANWLRAKVRPRAAAR